MKNEMILLDEWKEEELEFNELREFSEVIFAGCGVFCGGVKDEPTKDGGDGK